MKTAQLATLYIMCLLGILSGVASAQPYVTSTDGTEVTDQKTGLIWRRCVEGMNWDGLTCAGAASTYTHEAALQRATSQANSTAITWRLPNIKELASIADKTLSSPAIDAMAFPVTPASMFWSSSPVIDVDLDFPAWGVLFNDGLVDYEDRASSAYVRLVRAGQ